MLDPAGKKFRFGGGRVLPSISLVVFPARLAGKDIMFKSHVVNSDILLLWNRPSMTKAGIMLDFPHDKAKIFGKWTDLNMTSVGHYSIDILPRSAKSVEECMMTMPEDNMKEEKML